MHVRPSRLSLSYLTPTPPLLPAFPYHYSPSHPSSSPLLSSSLCLPLASPPRLFSMAGTATVCSMCGDVGFPEKLFRCARCRHRFQHSYCTNYYGDGAPASAGSDTCDWCLSDVAGKARWSSSSAAGGKQNAATGSQESSSTTSSGGSGRGGKQAAGDQQQAEAAGRRATTRAAGRRYKLLKDVLC